MKKMNESAQRMSNGGAVVVNANALVLVNTAVLAPTLVSQKIVNVSSYKSTAIFGSFNFGGFGPRP